MKVAGILLAVTLMVVALTTVKLFQQDSVPTGFAGIQGGDFTLNHGEQVFQLADLRGEAVAMFFGYTHCPDICPLTMANLAQAFRGLSEEELGQVRGLFVSVDPARDTPQHLTDYVRFFSSRMLGVSGSDQELRQLIRQYGAYYRLGNPDGSGYYAVDHTALIYLINPAGELVDTASHTASPQTLREQIRQLLATGS
ncbi:MAG: SCO family protein [Marinobacter sp.]|nr:SCO family protein [Marinobacter sp.]